MNRRLLVLVLLLAPFVAGCLIKDTTHRLYLSPQGAVEWSVTERDVRSSEREPGERLREEQEYLNRLHAGIHPIREALRHLEPDDLSIQLIRAERPYTTLVNARFQRAEVLVGKLFENLRIPGSATLRQRGDEATLVVAINLAGMGEGEEELDSPVAELVEDLDRYRIVLTAGQFVSADGFTIEDEGTAAKLRPEHVPVDRPAELRLTWKVR